jgi:hypothetical protein
MNETAQCTVIKPSNIVAHKGKKTSLTDSFSKREKCVAISTGSSAGPWIFIQHLITKTKQERSRLANSSTNDWMTRLLL